MLLPWPGPRKPPVGPVMLRMLPSQQHGSPPRSWPAAPASRIRQRSGSAPMLPSCPHAQHLTRMQWASHPAVPHLARVLACNLQKCWSWTPSPCCIVQGLHAQRVHTHDASMRTRTCTPAACRLAMQAAGTAWGDGAHAADTLWSREGRAALRPACVCAPRACQPWHGGMHVVCDVVCDSSHHQNSSVNRML